MKSKKIFLIIAGLLINQTLFSQYQKPDLSMPSPTAASLGAYGNIQVSLFTGLPIIGIHLHNLKEGSINVPITLNYHATGLQIDKHPGWVGSNWSLSAGGVITRSVKDLPDDYSNPRVPLKRFYSNIQEISSLYGIFDISLLGENAGYYYNHSINNVSNWTDKNRLNSLAESLEDGRDTEPDEFSFNFLGYSGKFFLSEQGNWKVQSDDNIKVILNEIIDLPTELQSSPSSHLHVYHYNRSYNIKTFGGFTLITDDGTQYIFGNNTDAIEYSIPFFYQYGEEWIATSWYLVKIISPDKREVEFNYEPDDFISNMYISFSFSLSLYINDDPSFFDKLFSGDATILACLPFDTKTYGFGDNEWAADWINPRYSSYLGNLIRPVYLSNIKTKNEEIIFNRNTTSELRYNNDIYIKNRKIFDLLYSKTHWQRIAPVQAGRDGAWPYLWDAVQIHYAEPETLLDALKWKKLYNIQIKDRNNLSVG